MTVQLTQKEKMLLEDQKKHEEICIEKYTNYANQATDTNLKQLFQSYATQEQAHLNTINQILNGQVPDMSQNSQNSGSSQSTQISAQYQQGGAMQGDMGNQADAALCNDMLMTEKYVSNTYDTAIFEFTNANIRQTLNHIQKEEQQHGEGIFNYMNSNSMYNPQ